MRVAVLHLISGNTDWIKYGQRTEGWRRQGFNAAIPLSSDAG